MKKIETYYEYEMLVKQFRKKSDITVNNLFLLPTELKKLIEEERFWGQESNNSLIFLADESSYYHLYYFWNPDYDLDLCAFDKDCLVEYIYNIQGKSDFSEVMREQFLRRQLKLNKVSYQIEILEEQRDKVLEAQYELNKTSLQKRGVTIKFAKRKGMNAIKRLWEEYLDHYDFGYLPEWEVDRMLESQEILVAVDKNGDILGSKCMKWAHKRSLGYHLVVSPSARGMGVGKQLMYEWFFLAKQKNIKICNAWVASDNEVSLKCHLIAGQKTGKVSEQYLLLKEK